LEIGVSIALGSRGGGPRRSVCPRNFLWNFLPTLRFTWKAISGCLPSIVSARPDGRLLRLLGLLRGWFFLFHNALLSLACLDADWCLNE
jgi:hypothetical protein